jgi:hypothetical protein
VVRASDDDLDIPLLEDLSDAELLELERRVFSEFWAAEREDRKAMEAATVRYDQVSNEYRRRGGKLPLPPLTQERGIF